MLFGSESRQPYRSGGCFCQQTVLAGVDRLGGGGFAAGADALPDADGGGGDQNQGEAAGGEPGRVAAGSGVRGFPASDVS